MVVFLLVRLSAFVRLIAVPLSIIQRTLSPESSILLQQLLEVEVLSVLSIPFLQLESTTVTFPTLNPINSSSESETTVSLTLQALKLLFLLNFLLLLFLFKYCDLDAFEFSLFVFTDFVEVFLTSTSNGHSSVV